MLIWLCLKGVGFMQTLVLNVFYKWCVLVQKLLWELALCDMCDIKTSPNSWRCCTVHITAVAFQHSNMGRNSAVFQCWCKFESSKVFCHPTRQGDGLRTPCTLPVSRAATGWHYTLTAEGAVCSAVWGQHGVYSSKTDGWNTGSWDLFVFVVAFGPSRRLLQIEWLPGASL